MGRLIDYALLVVLIGVIAAVFAHLLSLVVGACLSAGLAPVADALQYALNRAGGG